MTAASGLLYSIAYLISLSLLCAPLYSYEHHPDYSHYVHYRNISQYHLKQYNRIIFIGDIHGMHGSFNRLLDKVEYKPSTDLLVHLGDTITKGSHSLEVLSQLAKAKTIGVRGNHEQQVIEWRAWIEWVESHDAGKKWLTELERKYPNGIPSKNVKRLWWPYPTDWKFMEDHYFLARRMSDKQYEYLRNLPIVFHFQPLHTFVVHGGMLAFDPTRPLDNPHQPLASMPAVASISAEHARTIQEHALLTDIEANTNPNVILNLRTITEDGEATRDPDGTPWPKLWAKAMKHCQGYHHHLTVQEDDLNKHPKLPCLPINVIYGHYAARGLEVKRWSFGLDSGCVSGDRLTAMIISPTVDRLPHIKGLDNEIVFGDKEPKAQLISVSCS